METICGVRVQQKTARLILKTIDPDGERLCSIHKQSRHGPISWYIWIVITISYHKSFPFLVLHVKMGSPRIYSRVKTFNTKIIPSMWQDCITITSTQSKSGEFQG